jgi:hypothetical protein
MAASASATAASPKSASGGESPAAGPVGVTFSKNRSSSTGTGMTSVLFFSPATSTTVCSSRSCSAAGSWDEPGLDLVRHRLDVRDPGRPDPAFAGGARAA